MTHVLRNPELFSYIGAFVTIVLAIALSDMLMSLHRLIVARRRVKWRVIPLLAASFVFFDVLSEFFSIWVNADVAVVSFAYLVLLVFVSSASALAAFTALPDEVPEAGLDLWQSYLENRRYLFGVLIIGFVCDPLRAFAHSYLVHHGSVDPKAVGVMAALDLLTAGIFAVLAWSADKRVHFAGLFALYGIAAYGFAIWTIGA